MEILRVPPYQDVNFEALTVPAGFTNAEFTVVVTDMADLSETVSTVVKSTGQKISVSLPGLYDSSYRVVVSAPDSSVLADETVELSRPYVDPSTKGTLPSEISAYAEKEELARAVIDSIVPDGFYLKKTVLEATGLGLDYLPLWLDAKKILKVYENNVLVFDAASPETSRTLYRITDDKTAIIEDYTGTFNRREGAPQELPASPSDYVDLAYFGSRGFPKTYDYRIVLESGVYAVPSDIARATQLLIEDIECGKLEYYKRYVSSYNTDQFRIQFDSQSFEGTGNLIVDKILSKYIKSIRKIGVL
jgi:hypothetical protein